jgi:toxin CcdB
MIHQFDVLANPDPDEAAHWPYLVVLQSDLIGGLRSTVVAPLVNRSEFEGARRLNPTITIEGREFLLATHELFAVERRMLQKKITTVLEDRYTIMAALDFLFTGV